MFGRQVNSFNLIPAKGRGAAAGRHRQVARLEPPGDEVSLDVPVPGTGDPGRDVMAGEGHERDRRWRPAGRRRGGRVAQGVRATLDSFPIGEVAPISIIVRCGKADCAFDPNNREGIWKLTKDLEADERVARVESIANLNPSLTLEQFKAITRAARRHRPAPARIDRPVRQHGQGEGHLPYLGDLEAPRGGARDDGPGQGDRSNYAPSIRELRGMEVLVTSALTLDYPG